MQRSRLFVVVEHGRVGQSAAAVGGGDGEVGPAAAAAAAAARGQGRLVQLRLAPGGLCVQFGQQAQRLQGGWGVGVAGGGGLRGCSRDYGDRRRGRRLDSGLQSPQLFFNPIRPFSFPVGARLCRSDLLFEGGEGAAHLLHLLPQESRRVVLRLAPRLRQGERLLEVAQARLATGGIGGQGALAQLRTHPTPRGETAPRRAYQRAG